MIRIPDNIPYEHAAIITDAMSVSYHAIKKQARAQIADTLLIVGIGGLGIHAIQVAKLCGAKVIAADIDENKLRLASELGVDHTINPREVDPLSEVRTITRGLGVDAVIEMVGSSESVQWTFPALRNGGRLVIVGYTPGKPFPCDSMGMHYHEWEIVGSRLATREEMVEVVDLVAEGKIKPWVTRTFKLEEVNEVLDLLEQDKILGRAVLIL